MAGQSPIALRTRSHTHHQLITLGRGRTRSRPRSGRAIFVLCIVAPLLYTLYGSIKPYRTPVAEAVPTADRQPLGPDSAWNHPRQGCVMCRARLAPQEPARGPRALSRPHPFVYFMTAFFRQELIRARYHEWCAKPCAERARCTGKGLSPVSHPWLVGRFQPWLAGLRPEMQPARHRRHRRRRRRGLCAAQGACAARSSS